MIVYAVLSDGEYEDLITSYDFITKMEFTTKEQVKMAIEFCRSRNRLSTDIADYLLDLMNQLPHLTNVKPLSDSELINSINSELETTESNQDWQITGASAN